MSENSLLALDKKIRSLLFIPSAAGKPLCCPKNLKTLLPAASDLTGVGTSDKFTATPALFPLPSLKGSAARCNDENLEENLIERAGHGTG